MKLCGHCLFSHTVCPCRLCLLKALYCYFNRVFGVCRDSCLGSVCFSNWKTKYVVIPYCWQMFVTGSVFQNWIKEKPWPDGVFFSSVLYHWRITVYLSEFGSLNLLFLGLRERMHNSKHIKYLLVHDFERFRVVLTLILVWFRGSDDIRMCLCLAYLHMYSKTDIHERK